MKITVKLFATLREGRGKVLEKEYHESTSIKDILKDLKIAEEEVAILLKNGISSKMEAIPSDGDYLSIFPPVGGG
ncbi:MAG: MoaD/ThiS family protein [Sedimentibacter sp.]|uniref:MoaD/ThiS family protein n=1 Tax=Sedimentibacter sp. TaxID=1960295 RepID=UPI003158E614